MLVIIYQTTRRHILEDASLNIHSCMNLQFQTCTFLFVYGLRSLVVEFLFDIGKINPLNPELNPICYLLALLGARHFLHVSRIRVKLLTFRLLMSYIYEAPILDVSRSHTTTQHTR